MTNLGYCCINKTLNIQGIKTGRTMRKATFIERGLSYASELALQNSKDLLTIIQWNADNDIHLFRVGSGIFPWASEYDPEDLPDIDDIKSLLSQVGQLALSTNQRLSAHPDHFVKLASTKPHVVENSIGELELQSYTFDLMGLSDSPHNPINIHVGMNFSSDVVDRWIASYNRLSDRCKSRLVVENDDKPNSFSIKELYDNLHRSIDIPITFDYFHHSIHADGLDEPDAFLMAYETWGDYTPLFHYSDSKREYENDTARVTAHADYVYNLINDYGFNVDVDLEAKAKELALFHYRKSYD